MVQAKIWRNGCSPVFIIAFEIFAESSAKCHLLGLDGLSIYHSFYLALVTSVAKECDDDDDDDDDDCRDGPVICHGTFLAEVTVCASVTLGNVVINSLMET